MLENASSSVQAFICANLKIYNIYIYIYIHLTHIYIYVCEVHKKKTAILNVHRDVEKTDK